MSQEMDPKTEKLKEIGSAIKEQRESLGLSIEDVREKTLIRRKYLLAVEEGDDKAAPGHIYFKGFLKSYASFVGLDGLALAREYQAVLDKEGAPEPNRPRRTPRGESQRATPAVRRQAKSQARGHRKTTRQRSSALYVFLLLFVVALGIYYLASSGILTGVFPPTGQVDPPDTDPPDTDPPDTDPPDDPGTTVPPAESAIARSDPNSETSVWECQNVDRLELTIETLNTEDSHCWMRIVSDGEMIYEGTLVPGEKREVTGSSEIVVRAGKPWAITLNLNGETLGVGGELGPVKDLVFKIVPLSAS